MAIFKVKIRNVSVYETETLVEANTKEEAVNYLLTNCDWHEDGHIQDGGNYTNSFMPIEEGIEEIRSVSEIPEYWGEDSFAWNNDGETVKNLLN